MGFVALITGLLGVWTVGVDCVRTILISGQIFKLPLKDSQKRDKQDLSVADKFLTRQILHYKPYEITKSRN